MKLSNLFKPKPKGSDMCKHKHAYFFHDNAPQYCPDCNSYIDGGNIISTSNNNKQNGNN